MFGPALSVAGAGVSAAGRQRLPIRLMVSMLYLKHAFNKSDESVVERWSETVVWQFFCGAQRLAVQVVAVVTPDLPGVGSQDCRGHAWA